MTKTDGFKLHPLIMALITLINIFCILGIAFVQSIILAFGSQIENGNSLMNSLNYGIFFVLIDMVISFTMSRFESGKNLKKLSHIGRYYLSHNFIIDIIFIVNLIVFKEIYENVSSPEKTAYLLMIFTFTLIKMITSFRQV